MSARSTLSRLYLLRVKLVDIHPAVLRELLVPSSTTLDQLHDAIQAAFPWTNSHLHAFRFGRASVTSMEDPDAPRADERGFTVAEVLPTAGARMEYEYDFGDGWRHEIRVEEVLAPGRGAGRVTIRCVGGARACPPEGCGGPLVYPEMLLAIAHPHHARHQELTAWLAACRAEHADHDARFRGPFDPEAFDPVAANQAVGRATRRRRK